MTFWTSLFLVRRTSFHVFSSLFVAFCFFWLNSFLFHTQVLGSTLVHEFHFTAATLNEICFSVWRRSPSLSRCFVYQYLALLEYLPAPFPLLVDRPYLENREEVSRLAEACKKSLSLQLRDSHPQPVKGDVTVFDTLLTKVSQLK